MKTILAIAALTLVLANSGQAQPTTLSITLTATYQTPDKLSGPENSITTSTTKTVKITSPALLKLIAEETDSPFPNGSYLAQDAGNVEALDRAGYSTDLSPYFSINNSSATIVGSGTSNVGTGKTTVDGFIYTIIYFDDGNGNNFTVDGLIKGMVSQSATDANGNQIEISSFSGSVSGYGSVLDAQGNTDAAVFSGTFSGSGKGLVGS